MSRSPAAANPVVPDGQLGEFRHGTYPSFGIGDGDWTHAGVDLVAPCGSRVHAFTDWRVADVVASPEDPDFDSLGYMALVEHPPGPLGRVFHTLYLHLRQPPEVAVGNSVAGGETLLGRVGTTGCHTHFEVRFFPGRLFSDWGNIYGRGDRRGSDAFAENWADPEPLFAAYP